MKQIIKANIKDGNATCPKCKSLLCKVYYGGYAHGVELWCRRCKIEVLIEVNKI